MYHSTCTSGSGGKNYNVIIMYHSGKEKWCINDMLPPLSFPLNMYEHITYHTYFSMRFTVRYSTELQIHTYVHMRKSGCSSAGVHSLFVWKLSQRCQGPPFSILLKKNLLTHGVEFSWLLRWVGSLQLLQV